MSSTEQTFAGLTYTVTDCVVGGVELRIGNISKERGTSQRIEAQLSALANRFYARYATTGQPTTDQVSLVFPTGTRHDLVKILSLLTTHGALAEVESVWQ